MNAELSFNLDHGVTLASVGGKVWDSKYSTPVDDPATFDRLDDAMYDFGLTPDFALSDHQVSIKATQLAAVPDFVPPASYTMDAKRYALWRAGVKVLGKFLPYNWQVTGSCVGAGGGNMSKTNICVEIVLGAMEEYKEIWWPFAYGRSRFRSGSTRPGEGSSGSAWAEGAAKDGEVSFEEAGQTPSFTDGWLKLPSSVEMSWSDGDAAQTLALMPKAAAHLYGKVVRVRSADDALPLIVNGYSLTQASNFGFRSPTIKGTTQPIRVAVWNGSWSHQTYLDEYWDHPEVGPHWRWGNNWGPDAHGAPTGDEPPGGVYISHATFNDICQRGEVYAFFDFAGFKIRKLLDFLLS